MLQFTYFMDAEGKGKIRWLPRPAVSESGTEHRPEKQEVGICNGGLGPPGTTYRWRLLIVKIIHTIVVFYLHRVVVVVDDVVVGNYNHGANPQFIDFPQCPTPFACARFLILPQQKKIFQSSEHPLDSSPGGGRSHRTVKHRLSSSSRRDETRQSRKRSIDQILISLPLFGCTTPGFPRRWKWFHWFNAIKEPRILVASMIRNIDY